MSISIMSQVWANGPDDQSELMVMLILADHANDEGVCYPSQKLIAKKARMSDRNVRRVLSRLEDGGWFAKIGGRGRGNSTRYILNVGKIVKADKMSTFEKADICDAKSGHLGIKADTAMSYEPSLEPPIEPSYTPLPPKGGYSDAFEAFWELYPRKVGKGQAAKAFDRKAKKFGAGVVMDGLRRQLPMLNAQNKGPGQDYRPHPATWLNGDRFNDPVEHKPSLLERMANGTDDIAGPRAVDRWATGFLPAPIRNAQSSGG